MSGDAAVGYAGTPRWLLQPASTRLAALPLPQPPHVAAMHLRVHPAARHAARSPPGPAHAHAPPPPPPRSPVRRPGRGPHQRARRAAAVRAAARLPALPRVLPGEARADWLAGVGLVYPPFAAQCATRWWLRHLVGRLGELRSHASFHPVCPARLRVAAPHTCSHPVCLSTSASARPCLRRCGPTWTRCCCRCWSCCTRRTSEPPTRCAAGCLCTSLRTRSLPWPCQAAPAVHAARSRSPSALAADASRGANLAAGWLSAAA